MNWPRPLSGVRSIKLKLSIVIVAAVAATSTSSQLGYRLGWPLWARPLVAAAFGLVLAQILGRGMTRPLRELAAATSAMAAGDYRVRVSTSSADEVGRLATAFNAMATELAQLDRERRDLIANVSHELRTPLSGLAATLENLLDGVSEPDPQVLATMATQTQRLGRLVTDLLDLSRLESGFLELRIERVAVADLVDAALAEAGLHHPQLKVSAAIEPPDLMVAADPQRLHQVLANLLDNAARYGGSSVVVTAAATAMSAGAIRNAEAGVFVTVEDNGPGIDPGERERVFERFYRADRARSGVTSGVAGSGAGLGLAIARWVVDLHGGHITCDDAPDGGSRMTVSLPAAPAVVRPGACSLPQGTQHTSWYGRGWGRRANAPPTVQGPQS